jgi:carbon-monoxide dehydrogenase medium subunit
MYSTKYVKAKDIDDAATIMASAEDGKFLAGGMTLNPNLKTATCQSRLSD